MLPVALMTPNAIMRYDADATRIFYERLVPYGVPYGVPYVAHADTYSCSTEVQYGTVRYCSVSNASNAFNAPTATGC